MPRACVICCVLVIAAISVHDAALVAINDEVIAETEQNPIGRWMIQAAGGHVWFFITAKLAGATTVCAVILAIQSKWQRIAITVAVAIACLQLLLLGYLTMY